MGIIFSGGGSRTVWAIDDFTIVVVNTDDLLPQPHVHRALIIFFKIHLKLMVKLISLIKNTEMNKCFFLLYTVQLS